MLNTIPYFYVFLRLLRSTLVLSANFLFHFPLVSPLFAQQLPIEIDHYTFGSHSGTLSMEVQIINTDTLRNGAFTYQSIINDSDPFLSIFHVKGNYQSNRKQGDWFISVGDFIRVGDYELSNYRISQKISGKEHLYRTQFEDNALNGNWNYLYHTIYESQPVDTTTYLQTSFTNGFFSGGLQYEDTDVAVSLSFNQEGLLHGEQFFRRVIGSTEHLEIQQYDEGKLRQLSVVMEMDTIPLQRFISSDSIANWKRVCYSEEYILYLKVIKTLEAESKSYPTEQFDSFVQLNQQTLKQLFSSFTSVDTLNLWESKSDQVVENTIARIPVYPFIEHEKNEYERLISLSSEIKQAIESVTINDNIQLQSFKNRSLEELIQQVNAYNHVLNSIRPVLEVIQKPYWLNVDRQAFLRSLVKPITYADSLSFRYKDSTISIPFTQPSFYPDSTEVLPSLLSYLSEVQSRLSSLNVSIENEVEKTKSTAEIQRIEQEMFSQKTLVLSTYSQENNSLMKDKRELIPIFSSIQTVIQHTFDRFMTLNNREKIAQSDSVLACYSMLNSQHQILANYEKYQTSINEIYTRSIWDPFTFTEMEEKVKPRLHRFYTTYVQPNLLEKIRKSTSCSALFESMEDLKKAYQMMVKLRNEDTAELEGKLRKESNYSEVMMQLGFEPFQ